MQRSGEEPQGGNNSTIPDEVRLNLPLQKTSELINLIESYQQQHYPYIQQNIYPKNPEKIKAMSFPISKIVIGQWTSESVYTDDIVAKFYFAKKKLLWEFLVPEKTETNMERMKKKIEIQWDDVSSLKRSFYLRDETGILEVELRKRPTFFRETNPQAGKHTQWKQIQDFTENQSSLCRRHTLHFNSGVLQKNFEKLVSSDNYWSELVKVPFPLVKSLYFDIFYENTNNTTFSFDVNNNFPHSYFQGIGHMGDENFNMTTELWTNDGMQINSYGQTNTRNNIANEYFEIQAALPSSQVIYDLEHYNMGMYSSGSECPDLMIQEEEMQNRDDLLTSQAYDLPDTQPTLTYQYMNELPMSPKCGSYLADILFLEEESQYVEYTNLDGNVQTDDHQQTSFHQSSDNYYYSHNNNNYPYTSINNKPTDMNNDLFGEEK